MIIQTSSRLFALILLGFGAACLSGCAPLPDDEGPPVATASAPGTIYTVGAGDTLHSVSTRFGVPDRTIIDANRLAPPYTLSPGMRLFVPKPSDYVVAKGDTVYGLSRRFGVDMSSLVRENSIAAPYKIRIGQVLRLPAPVVQSANAAGTGMATTEIGSGVPPAPSSSGPVSSLPPSSGAATLDVTGPAPISAPTTASSIDVAPLAPPSKAGGVASAAPTAPAKTLAEPSLGVSIPAKPAAAAVQANIPVPAPRADSRFLWPIHGKIVSAFGVKQGGLHNDGINIEAPRGTVVRAAENGVVVYAGNELRGFGNLLLIKHADGWTTAYAHNEQILVQRGDQVKRGQPIAKVGATGNVTTPQLHFELREGTEAVDPVRYLGSQSAENGGAG